MVERLARASSRHPGRAIAVWVVAVLAAIPAIGLFLGDVLTTDVEITSDTESNRAGDLLFRAFPENLAEQQRDMTDVVVVRAEDGDITADAAAARIDALADELRAAGATAVVTESGGTPLISRDRDARAVPAGLGFDGEDDVPAVYDVVQRLDDEPGYDAAVTGELTSDADQGELSADDLRTGELFFGMPAAS